ncbi:hypothetical protein GCM10027056_08880 [Glaciibacter psychrotolerans]
MVPFKVGSPEDKGAFTVETYSVIGSGNKARIDHVTYDPHRLVGRDSMPEGSVMLDDWVVARVPVAAPQNYCCRCQSDAADGRTRAPLAAEATVRYTQPVRATKLP